MCTALSHVKVDDPEPDKASGRILRREIDERLVVVRRASHQHFLTYFDGLDIRGPLIVMRTHGNASPCARNESEKQPRTFDDRR